MTIIYLNHCMSYKLICHAAFAEFAHTSLMEFLRLSNAVDGVSARWTKSAVDMGKVGV